MDDPKDELIQAIEDAGFEVAFDYTPTPEQAAAAGARLAAKDQALRDLAGTLPVANIDFDPIGHQQNTAWDDMPDKLWLLTPVEFDRVPDGVVLVGIDGDTRVKGSDTYFDRDTRGGFMAWGLLNSQLPQVTDG